MSSKSPNLVIVLHDELFEERPRDDYYQKGYTIECVYGQNFFRDQEKCLSLNQNSYEMRPPGSVIEIKTKMTDMIRDDRGDLCVVFSRTRFRSERRERAN